MPFIQIMNENLANRIAAGEVVERPASVVKELVENAIDAQSTTVEVSVFEGGLEGMKVVDNGQGMGRDDALLSLARHASSKLIKEQDLFRISTLGFRGEALPSIASVSHLSIQTWDGQEEVGTQLVVHGGEIIEITDAPLRKGTIIEVSQLFYNTPARYKYLKSTPTEISHISDYMNRLAMAYPHIAFTLKHNDKLLLKTNGQGRLLAVLAEIYGRQIAQKMIPFSYENIDFKAEGYLSQPDLTRSNRQYISILINGRYVKNYLLSQMVLRAYHTLLPINRFPLVVLSLNMDPSLIDVNVHPAKLEVRLSKEKELLEWLEAELGKTLQQQQKIPQPLSNPQGEKRKSKRHIQEQIQFQLPSERTFSKMLIKEQGNLGMMKQNQQQKTYPAAYTQLHSQKDAKMTDEIAQEALLRAYQAPDGDDRIGNQVEENIVKESLLEESTFLEKIPMLFPLAQLHGTYILAQNENGLYMIDQHAAQERIWYEHFYQKLNQPVREKQDLLVPLILEFTAGEVVILQEYKHVLAELGLNVEEFGHHTYMLRSHPIWFPSGEEEALIREIVDYLLQHKKAPEWIVIREKLAMMMSCKQAIKANQFLTIEEMESLVEQLRLTTNPFTCPHGRPITVLLSTYEIEKMFKRVM